MDPFDDDVVRFLTFDIGDKADTTGISLKGRIIESLRLGKSLEIIVLAHSVKNRSVLLSLTTTQPTPTSTYGRTSDNLSLIQANEAPQQCTIWIGSIQI